MSVAGARETAEPNAVVPREEWLLRLNFNPEHIENGQVRPSAVSLSDLKSRGYSVDREHLVDITIIAERAKDQAANKPDLRQAPFLSKFECGPVCGEVDTAGQAAFRVEASPVAATELNKANPAHAHIMSAIHRGDAGLRQIRLLLLPYLQRLIPLDAYMAGVASNDDDEAADEASEALISPDPNGAV